MKHTPVLAQEVLFFLKTAPLPMTCFLDGTFGRGGHTRLIMEAFPSIKVIAFDRDQQAIDESSEIFKKKLEEKQIQFIHSNFANIQKYQQEIYSTVKQDFLMKLAKIEGSKSIASNPLTPLENHREIPAISPFLSGALLDLGVSSPQLDEAERGFSFYKNGPLDMRMDQKQKLSASSIVNEWNEEQLIDIFKKYGEIWRPQKVVQAIVKNRKKKSFESTLELAQLIERLQGWRKKGQHPATPFFLALRLEVNQELQDLRTAIPPLVDILQEGGRLLIITFHSLEDRIVKTTFKSMINQGKLVNKKVVQASWLEKKKNPRARSAKLRVFEKGSI